MIALLAFLFAPAVFSAPHHDGRGVIYTIDLNKYQPPAPIPNPFEWVQLLPPSYMEFSPDGKTLYIKGSSAATIKSNSASLMTLNIATKTIQEMKLPKLSKHLYKDFKLAPDGKTIYIADNIFIPWKHRPIARKYDATTGKHLGDILLPHSYIDDIALSKDGKLLYALSTEPPPPFYRRNCIYAIDLNNPGYVSIAKLKYRYNRLMTDKSKEEAVFAYSDARASLDNAGSIARVEGKTQVSEPLNLHFYQPTSIVESPDGSKLYLYGKIKSKDQYVIATILLPSFDSLQVLLKGNSFPNSSSSLAISPDGKKLYLMRPHTVGTKTQCHLYCYNTTNLQKPIHTMLVPLCNNPAMPVSPDGKTLYISSNPLAKAKI